MKALIFDVDGTLAETEELHRLAFNDSFAEAGLGWCWDRALYRRLLAVSGGKERIRHFIDACGGQPDLPADRLTALHAAKTRRYAALLDDGAITLRPGVERLLREARLANVRLAIATTTTLANAEALLGATLGSEGPRWFEVIAAGDAVPAKKPAADIYRLVLRKLSLDAAECIAFEDTSNGLASAGGAGIATVITMSTYGDSGPFTGALAVTDHLGEPSAPCRVLAGPPTESGVVDLTTLDRWRRAAQGYRPS
jgi:HAD superfamily hydrolase (TIGR01509 family)